MANAPIVLPVATTPEMEAGTEAALRSMSPELVAQAIAVQAAPTFEKFANLNIKGILLPRPNNNMNGLGLWGVPAFPHGGSAGTDPESAGGLGIAYWRRTTSPVGEKASVTSEPPAKIVLGAGGGNLLQYTFGVDKNQGGVSVFVGFQSNTGSFNSHVGGLGQYLGLRSYVGTDSEWVWVAGLGSSNPETIIGTGKAMVANEALTILLQAAPDGLSVTCSLAQWDGTPIGVPVVLSGAGIPTTTLAVQAIVLSVGGSPAIYNYFGLYGVLKANV